MASGIHRKRLEVDEGLYWELQRRADWLHMPVARLAELLLREGLAAAEQRALTPQEVETNPYHPIHQERARQARERAVENNPHLQDGDLRY